MRLKLSNFLAAMGSFFVILSSALGQDSTWKQYSPPTGEFSVKLPNGSDVSVQDSKSHTKMYLSKSDDGDFQVQGGVALNWNETALKEFTGGLEGAFKERYPGITITHTPASGSGWQGEQLGINKDGRLLFQALIAEGTGSPVVFALVSSATSKERQSEFFNSFTLDNAKLAAVYEKELDEARMNPDPAFRRGYLIGRILGFLAFPAIIIAIVVALFRRAKKKPGENTDPQ